MIAMLPMLNTNRNIIFLQDMPKELCAEIYHLIRYPVNLITLQEMCEIGGHVSNSRRADRWFLMSRARRSIWTFSWSCSGVWDGMLFYTTFSITWIEFISLSAPQMTHIFEQDKSAIPVHGLHYSDREVTFYTSHTRHWMTYLLSVIEQSDRVIHGFLVFGDHANPITESKLSYTGCATYHLSEGSLRVKGLSWNLPQIAGIKLQHGKNSRYLALKACLSLNQDELFHCDLVLSQLCCGTQGETCQSFLWQTLVQDLKPLQ